MPCQRNLQKKSVRLLDSLPGNGGITVGKQSELVELHTTVHPFRCVQILPQGGGWGREMTKTTHVYKQQGLQSECVS